MEHKNTQAIVKEQDGIYCTTCKQHFKFTEPSKIYRHVETKIHRKYSEQVGAAPENVPNRGDSLSSQNVDMAANDLGLPQNGNGYEKESFPDIGMDDKSNIFENNERTEKDKFHIPFDFVSENARLKKENAILQDQVLQSLLRSSQSNQSKSTNESDNPRSQQLPSDTIGSAESAGGFTLRMLRDMLDQRDSELKQLREELLEYKLADPHSQCKQTIKLLETQLKSVQMEREKYRDHRDELAIALGKKIGQAMDEHMNGSESNQTDQDEENGDSRIDINDNEEKQEMQIDTRSKHQHSNDDKEENKESDVAVICPYCNVSLIGPPPSMTTEHGIIRISGVLYNHWQTCSYFDKYHQRLDQVAKAAAVHFVTTEKHLIQSQLVAVFNEEDPVIQCFKLSSFFSANNIDLAEFLTDWKMNKNQSYPFPSVEKDNSINNDLEFFESFSRVISKETYHHQSYGVMKKNQDGSWIDVTQVLQENNLTKMKMDEFRYRCATCKKLFSCEVGWKQHTKWMLNCGRTCICDVFSFAKYSHSLEGTSAAKVQREIKKKELKKLEALIETTMKKPELIEPEKFNSALETKRNIQREDSISFAKQTKEQLMLVEGWLMALAQQCERSELKALDAPICDAIVYPRCPLIFGDDVTVHDEKLAVHLKSHLIPVRSVGNVSTNDKTVAFIYLLDSDNKFTTELIENLDRSLEELATEIKEQVPRSELLEQRLKSELENLYIRQTDYAKDFLGFFMANSLFTEQSKEHKFDILRQIGLLIGMNFSENHDQLVTSIQFESFVDGLRSERLKVYTKLAHLLLTYSFKAKLSMGTRKLFKAPLAFHQKKLQPSFNDGLTRIELSSYFHSAKEWKQKALNVNYWEEKISNVQNALHSVEEVLVYKVNFKVFWDSFWFSVDAATAIIDFLADLWTTVYAYSSRSYLFTGHHTDKHAKSGAQLTFLQRFASVKTLVRVNNGQKTKQFLIDRHGRSRQIPIGSLNVKQVEENRMPIDMTTWFYHLSKEQLNQTYFTCDNQEEFDEWFGQDPALTRPDMSEPKNQIDQPMSDAEEQMPQSNIFQKEHNEVIDTSPQQTHERKREETKKRRSRSRSQDKEILKQTKTRERSKSAAKTNFKKNGSIRGQQRWQCLICKAGMYVTEGHECDM